MCGIWLYLVKQGEVATITESQMFEAFNKSQHRGPDKSIFMRIGEYGLWLGFHRLAIMDPMARGDQPFYIEDENHIIYSVCNGEIYNYLELEKKYDLHTTSGSDCEILPQLYRKIGMNGMISELNGEFAFMICDIDKKSKQVSVFVGRDHCGIRPLYVSGTDNEIMFCSELIGSPFLSYGYEVEQVKPRNWLHVSNTNLKLYSNKLNYTEYVNFSQIPRTITNLEYAKYLIRESLIRSVRERMMSDRPIGCLLSGGLDSSLVATIMSRECKKLGKTLYTFSIGMPGGTDEKYAKMVAMHIGSSHTHIELDEKVWLNSLPTVNRILGTYDCTTNRATCGQWQAGYYVATHTDIKVLLIGDISDEVAGSYMYFHNAPNPKEFDNECVRLVDDIHHFDVKRSDRGIASNGIECRVPFGSLDYIKTYLSVDPQLRMPRNGIEKWLLREAFNCDNWLPDEVLWRYKCAFSDGCSSKQRSWYQIIQEMTDRMYTDEEFEEKKKSYTYLAPHTKEMLYYRELFESVYGKSVNTSKIVPYYWLPKWCGDITEPSARVLEVCKE